jgi:uncharacterized membrane protein YfcA
MDSPVYTVNVMIVGSMAIQSLSVAALRHSIDWRGLPIVLTGGLFGVPAGAFCCCIFRRMPITEHGSR